MYAALTSGGRTTGAAGGAGGAGGGEGGAGGTGGVGASIGGAGGCVSVVPVTALGAGVGSLIAWGLGAGLGLGRGFGCGLGAGAGGGGLGAGGGGGATTGMGSGAIICTMMGSGLGSSTAALLSRPACKAHKAATWAASTDPATTILRPVCFLGLERSGECIRAIKNAAARRRSTANQCEVLIGGKPTIWRRLPRSGCRRPL